MAEKVTYWKAQDGSLHATEEEAVEQEISLIGEEAFYKQMLDKVNNAYGESRSFRYYEIPERITHRFIDDGYVAQLYSTRSNADSNEHYDIVIYKRGIQPTDRRDWVIKPKAKV